MTALIDTHVFIWATVEPARLSSTARTLIEDGENVLLLSAASAWEIAIKTRLGRLQLPDSPDLFVPREMQVACIQGLPADFSHCLRVARLPLHHRDPFDRLLIAQAQVERIPIVTSDPKFRVYDIEVIW